MRLLHTGDWHVGKTLRGRSRLDEHAAVLAELVGVAERSDVGLVLVAGDLFDVASPAPEAERLVYRTLLDLADGGRQVVVIAGNHDSAARLAAVAPLAARAEVIVAGSVRAPHDGGVLELDVAGEAVRLALLPWLSPRYVVDAAALLDLDADQHQQNFAARVGQVIGALCAGFSAGTVNLLLGHLHAAGGTLGGGERLAHTVFDYAVSALAFPSSCQYAALGHLHRSQRIPGPCPLWYPGSPLALDFGETADPKGALLVEVTAGRPALVEVVPLNAGRHLRTLVGSMADLRALAGSTGTDLLRIVIEEPARAGLADEVRDLFPDALDVRLASAPVEGTVGPSPSGPGHEGAEGGAPDRSPQDLFAGYLAERRVEDPRLEALFAELLEEASSPARGLLDEPVAGPAGSASVDVGGDVGVGLGVGVGNSGDAP